MYSRRWTQDIRSVEAEERAYETKNVPVHMRDFRPGFSRPVMPSKENNVILTIEGPGALN